MQTSSGRSQKRLSPEALAEIARRIDSARPGVLAELERLCASREGSITPEQLHAFGAILSHLHEPIAVETALEDVLTNIGADVQLGSKWRASPHGKACIQAASFRPAARRDFPISQLLRVFGISEAESDALGLRRLVSERVRAEHRRREEGGRSRAEVAATRPATIKPWWSENVSRATAYRLKAAAKVAPALKLIEDAAPTEDAPDRSPWIAAGVSRATWYRNLVQHPRGSSESAETKLPMGYTEYSIAESELRASAVVSKAVRPAKARFRTAESRRLVALGEQLGLSWSLDSRGLEQPATWFDLPPGTLSVADELRYEAAVHAAVEAEQRRQAVVAARGRRGMAGEATPPRSATEILASIERDDAPCPGQVSPAVWAAVPVGERRSVLVMAGRFFRRGHSGDLAVGLAVNAARRERVLAARVAETFPDLPTSEIDHLVRDLWRKPTEQAVAEIVAVVEAKRSRRLAAEAAIRAALAGTLIFVTDAERQGLAVEAVDAMCGWPNLKAEQALQLAAESRRKHW